MQFAQSPFLSAPPRALRREIPLYHIGGILSIVILHKNLNMVSQIFVQFASRRLGPNLL